MLEVAHRRELLRAAEDARPRDRAIVTLLLYTAIRLRELLALDVDDLSLSARKGPLVVKCGKGDLYREVPVNSSWRRAGWLSRM
ncbi:MAG: tyrosine-type recombinase/integrase [Solirubrobacteraceae bacterium]